MAWGSNKNGGAHRSMMAKHNSNGHVQLESKGVFAIEEHLVVPCVGLSGYVDVSLEANVTGNSKSLIPLELKTTCKQDFRADHTAQLSLYTLMTRMAHGNRASGGGILLYLNDKSYTARYVCPPTTHLKTLIALRNAFVQNIAISEPVVEGDVMKRQSLLPAMSISSFACSICYSNSECMLYNKAGSSSDNDHRLDRDKPWITEMVGEKYGHLTDKHVEYFREWDTMIDLEFAAKKDELDDTQPWLEPSVEREARTRRTASDMVWNCTLDPGAGPLLGADKYQRAVMLRFERRLGSCSVGAGGGNLRALSIEVGDRLVVSTDGSIPIRSAMLDQTKCINRINIASGYVAAIEETCISLKCEESQWTKMKATCDDCTVSELRLGSDALAHYGSVIVISNTARFTRHQVDGRVSSNLRFRLDHTYRAALGGSLRYNLAKMFIKSDDENNDGRNQNDTSAWLRAMIIDMEKPKFDEFNFSELFGNNTSGDRQEVGAVKGCDLTDLMMEYYEDLNKEQKVAVEKVVSMRDYSLMQGLPGTGKTRTICYIARLLVAKGLTVLVSEPHCFATPDDNELWNQRPRSHSDLKSVPSANPQVTSYTHSAVDNILTKLLECGVGIGDGLGDMLRITSSRDSSRCSDQIKQIIPMKVAEDRYGVVCDGMGDEIIVNRQSLEATMNNAKVVGCTCLSIGKSELLRRKKFDVIIVDEAGQITQPAILNALGFAKKFVLVGDHQQLPPLVKSKAALDAGYGVSLLKRLCERWDRDDTGSSCITKLTSQYRMHADICFFCNQICYKGLLKCANKSVESRLVQYHHAWKTSQVQGEDDLGTPFKVKRGWIQHVLEPKNVVCFLNTDGLSLELESGRRVQRTSEAASTKGAIVNETEAQIIERLIRTLDEKCLFNMKDVGIITPYKAQIKKLVEVPFLKEKVARGLEVSTVDTFQGRDKKVIFISFVRSNSVRECGNLLKDFRRLNVAVSRAKLKLIMVGSSSTLKNLPVMNELLKCASDKGWVAEFCRTA